MVRPSIAPPPRRSGFCATCGVIRRWRHSSTNPRVSNPLWPATVKLQAQCDLTIGRNFYAPLALYRFLLTLFPGLFKFDHSCVPNLGHYIPRDERTRPKTDTCYPLPNLWSCSGREMRVEYWPTRNATHRDRRLIAQDENSK